MRSTLPTSPRPVRIPSSSFRARSLTAAITLWLSSALRRALQPAGELRAIPRRAVWLYGRLRRAVRELLSIDKRQLDRAGAGRIGALDEMAWREVVKAIGYVVRSDCEPT